MLVFCLSGAPTEAPRTPKGALGEFKTHPGAPEESLRAAKEAPREPNGPKRTPKTRPRAPKHAPRAPIEARKPLDSLLCTLYTLHFSCLLSTLDLRLSTLYSLLSTLNSLLPTLYCLGSSLYSLLPTPYSLLPTRHSLLPRPYALLLTPNPLLLTPYFRRALESDGVSHQTASAAFTRQTFPSPQSPPENGGRRCHAARRLQ